MHHDAASDSNGRHPLLRTSQWLIAMAIACAFATAQAGAEEWFTLPSSPTAAGRHDDLWFTDELNGWVVNGQGEIWHTSDGGISWDQQADLPAYLRAVTFASPLHGWTGTLFANDRLYETTNGGATWIVVPNLPPQMPSGICGMWAASENVVYAVGQYSMPAGIMKTTNAGAFWVFQDISNHARTLVDCYFFTPEIGLAVGSTGLFADSSQAVVLRTTNGGTNWNRRYISPRLGAWAWKISFPSASIGYVSIESSIGPMTFLKTTDGGISWTEKLCPNSNEQGIGFLNDDVGWLGGWGSPTYSTTDGGENWEPLNFMVNLNRIRFLESGVGYAAGQRVYRYGNDPTDVAALLASDRGLLSASMPNPFSMSATVEFTLLNPAEVRLEIYDVAGRCVRTVVASPRPAGMYRALWDGRNAAGSPSPSGIYFWRLEAEGRSESQKILLVR